MSKKYYITYEWKLKVLLNAAAWEYKYLQSLPKNKSILGNCLYHHGVRIVSFVPLVDQYRPITVLASEIRDATPLERILYA